MTHAGYAVAEEGTQKIYGICPIPGAAVAEALERYQKVYPLKKLEAVSIYVGEKVIFNKVEERDGAAGSSSVS